MSKKYKKVHVTVVDDQNIAEITLSPYLESATFSPDLLVKKRKHKTFRSKDTNSSREQNNSNSSTALEGRLEQFPLPSETCEETTVESQTPRGVTVKSTKKKARASRKSTERQQGSVEVYVGKFASTETSLLSNVVDRDLAGDHLLVSDSKNGATEEDMTENEDAVLINNVLESEFFKIKCSEVHQDKEHKGNNPHDDHSSQDYFIFNEQTQEGSERQDQIHEGDDDQMCGGSVHSIDSPAETRSLDGQTATHADDGLEFREVPPEELTHTDLIGEPEENAKDLDCLECALTTGSHMAPEGLLDRDLLESEQFEDASLDLPAEEFSHTDPEHADCEFKPVGEMCIVNANFPMEVAMECEVTAGDAEPSSSLLSPCVSLAFEKSRSTSATREPGPLRRKIKAPVHLERPSAETVSSENAEPRQAIAKSKKQPRLARQTVEDSATREPGPLRRKIQAPVHLERPSAETVSSENAEPRQAIAKSKKQPRLARQTVEDSATREPCPLRRKIQAPVRLERPSAETVSSENAEPRQAITKSKRQPKRARQTVEDSSACPQAEAIVNAKTSKTVGLRKSRTATKRKVVLDQTLSSEPVVTEESSTPGKMKLTDNQTDRPVPAEKSESAMAEKPFAVVKRKSKCGRTGRAKSASTDVSEFKSLSVLIERCKPVAKRKYTSRQVKTSETVSLQKSLSKPVPSNESLSKLVLSQTSLSSPVSSERSLSSPVSSERSLSKPVSLGNGKLLEKPLSAVKVKSKSVQAKNLDPPVVEQPGSVNRSRVPVKRKAKTLDAPADASQTDYVESELTRKPEPPLKRASIISSGTDNGSRKVSPETVGIFDRLVQKPSDSVCLSGAHASQNIVSSDKQKPTEAIVIPPPEYISFTHTGDVEISEIILNAIPQFVENGSSQIYLLTNNVTLPSSDRQESLVFAADLSSIPYKFVQTTSFPNKKSASGLLADKIPEAQAAEEILVPQKSFRKEPAKSRLLRKQTTQCSSSLDHSSALEADDSSLSLNVDVASSTGQLVMPATNDQVSNPSTGNWTSVDTSAWLAKHGLDRLIPNFSCLDGPSLVEMAHYFNGDSKGISKYLQDMGLLFTDEMKLFAALRTLPTQMCNNTCSSSAEVSHAGAADLSSQVTEMAAPAPRKRGRPPNSVSLAPMMASGGTNSPLASGAEVRAPTVSVPMSQVTEMAAPAPRKRGRPPNSVRWPPMMASGGTNSPLASGAEVRAPTLSVPMSQWTCQDVSAWLTSQGQARFLPEFVHFDGQSMSELVRLFNTDVRTVHRRLYNMDFTLFESLVFCAGLRTLSLRQEEACLRFSQQ